MSKKHLLVLLAMLVITAFAIVGCSNEEATTDETDSVETTPEDTTDTDSEGTDDSDETPEPVQVDISNAEYVGSDSCAGCHNAQHSGWSETAHPLMVQNVEKNPDAIKDYTRELMEAELADWENSEFTTIGGDNEGKRLTSLDELVYVVGGEWKQRGLIRTEHGFNFVQFQANPEWVTADGEVVPARLNNYGGGQQYEDRCLGCHTTGFDYEEMLANQDRRGNDDYYFEDFVGELGVGCEACHGPASEHVSNPNKETILNPANLTAQQELDFCGTCHARNDGQIDPHTGEAMNHQDSIFYEWGDDLYDHKLVNSLARGENVFVRYDEDGNVEGYWDGGGSQRFWADGSARSHRMQYNELEANVMKMNLDFTCSTCHDLHDPSTLKGGSWEALISADLERNGTDQSCHQCHDTNWDINEAMPYTAMSANGVQDMRQHTFGTVTIGDVPEDDNE